MVSRTPSICFHHPPVHCSWMNQVSSGSAFSNVSVSELLILQTNKHLQSDYKLSLPSGMFTSIQLDNNQVCTRLWRNVLVPNPLCKAIMISITSFAVTCTKTRPQIMSAASDRGQHQDLRRHTRYSGIGANAPNRNKTDKCANLKSR